MGNGVHVAVVTYRTSAVGCMVYGVAGGTVAQQAMNCAQALGRHRILSRYGEYSSCSYDHVRGVFVLGWVGGAEH
jgi:hypothetical protein